MEWKDAKILQKVLPNLSNLPGLITEYYGNEVLKSIPWSDGNRNLQQIQQIVILSNKNELLDHLDTDREKVTAYIIIKGKQYLTVIVNRLLERLYFIHIGQQLNDFKEFLFYPIILKNAFHTFKIMNVFCKSQDGCNSFAQAYINARVFSWGMMRSESKSRVDKFIDSVIGHPILFKENAATMYLYSDFVNFSENEQRVEDVIVDGIVRGKTLADVESEIATEGFCKCRLEQAYIKNCYIKHCLNQFLIEMENHFDNCQDPSKLALQLQAIHNFNDLHCKPFIDTESYVLVQSCKSDMNEIQKQSFIEHLLRNCWVIIVGKIEMFQYEESFIEEFGRCIKESFKRGEDFLAAFDIVAHQKSEDILEQLLDKLTIGKRMNKEKVGMISMNLVQKEASMQKTLPTSNRAQGTAREMHTEQTVFETQRVSALTEIALQMYGMSHSANFFRNFKQIVNEVNSQAEITFDNVNNKTSIFYRKAYVYLNEAISDIIEEIETLDNVSEIKIFAHELLMVDDNFTWNGTNVVIASKEIAVVEGKSYVWNVSGRCASKHKLKKAPDGKRSGENGFAGEHGYHGESGGNVLLITDKIINAENLMIISNGGNGSDGQDGGHGISGKNGQDGIGLDLETFKSKFPDPAYPVAIVFKLLNISDIMGKCRSNANRMIRTEERRTSEYSEFTTLDGNHVKMAFFKSLTSSTQSYCIHEGTSGTRGTKGGDGGCGGKAGLGGYPGDIQFVPVILGKECRFDNVIQQCYRGSHGNEGSNGKGGNGGKNGKRGIDNARITTYSVSPTHWLHGHLELKFYNTWNNEHYYAWCPWHEKYARIHTNSPPQYPALAECGSNGKNTKTVSGKKQTQRRRQAAILSREIVQQFKKEVGIKLTNQQALQNTANTIKEMAHDSIASISHSIQQIHRQTLVTPQDKERSNIWQLDIPQVVTVVEEKLCRKPTNPGEILLGPKNKELANIIYRCHASISFSNWFNQLRQLSTLLQSTPEVFRSDKIEVIQILRKFTEHLQDNDLEKHVLVDIYDCIITMSKVDQVLFEGLLEKIQAIALIKQKFALIQDINQRLFTSCKSRFEYSSKKNEIEKLDSSDRDKMMQYCIQGALLRAIRQFQECCSMNNLIETYETISQSISITSNSDYIFNDLLEPEIRHSNDSECLHLLSLTPNTLRSDVDDTNHANSHNTKDCDGQDKFVQFEKHLSGEHADTVKTLKFHELKCMVLLRHVMCDRLVGNPQQISSTILKWLMSVVIGIENTITVSAFTVMFALNQPRMWLLEFIVIQMRIMMDLSLQEEARARYLLGKVDNEQWMLLISQKLGSINEEDSVPFCLIEESLELLQADVTEQPDESTLCRCMTSSLSEWPAQLQWRQELLVLQSIPVNFTSDAEKIQTAEYLWGLRNRYGDEFITKLQNSVNKHTQVYPHAFTMLLRNLYNNKWRGDGSCFEIVATMPCNQWAKKLDNYSARAVKRERSLDTLFDNLGSVKNSSFPKKKFEKVKQIVLKIYAMEKSVSRISKLMKVPKFSKKCIEQFTCSDITIWCRTLVRSEVKENIPEVLAIIKRGIYLMTGCLLRDTQLIAIVLFLFNEQQGMLEQVSTGEGKSYIIAALAIFKTLSGSKVDIITSSSVLAKRDANENRKIYKLFRATVSHNCCEEEKKLAYKADIVYGEISTFQRDILLDEFYNENIMGDRTSENVIVDEVDSMLLDKGQNVLYLSHDVSGLDSLHQVYIHIWSFVHSKGLFGSIDDEDVVYKGMLDALFGTFRSDDIEKAWLPMCTLTSNEVDNLWCDMITQNLIDESGTVIAERDVINTFTTTRRLSSKQQGVLFCCVKNALDEAISSNRKIVKEDFQNKWMAANQLTKEQIHKLHQTLVLQGVIDHEGIIQDKETIMSDRKIITLSEIHLDQEIESSGETPLEMFPQRNKRVCRESNQSYGKTNTKLQGQLPGPKESDIIACITNALKDSVRKGTTLCIPYFLEDFIRRHLRTWIRNAFKARFLNESEHYIVDVDRSSNYQDACDIIIMDTDTGTEQYNTQWNQGLHQFLQLKHGCRISSESLKAVFMSNISFFKRYNQHIYGLTGTLGSEGERRLLQNLYSIDYVTIPTFRPSSFFEEDGILCPSHDLWLDQISKCVAKLHKSRPVLVICETIKDLEAIEVKLKQTVAATLHIYKHSYEEPEVFKRDGGIEKGCIILATNLAGRGTDIKIGEEINDSGGLFVCLTYLPSNVRVEQQAFGRTARKGQQGSGQMIILDEEVDASQIQTQNIFKFVNLKARRDIIEKQRIGKIQSEYENKQKVEEQFFKKFEQSFTTFREVLKNIMNNNKQQKIEMSLLQQVLLDKWALWLDAHADEIGKRNSRHHVDKLFHQFLSIIDDATREIRDGRPQYKYIDSFANRNRLGKMFISRKEFNKAQNLFDEVIKTEPKFSETAHYYKAHCIMKEKDVILDDTSKANLLYHLHQAKHLMQTRIDELQNATVIVQTLSHIYINAQNSFLVIDEFGKQNEGVINLYTIYIRSIDDILGHEITPVVIEDITQDPIQAKVIHNDLLTNKCLTRYVLAPDYNEHIQEFQDEYALYIDKLKVTLKELDSIHSYDSAHELDSIHSNDSAHELDSIHSYDSVHELDSIHSNDSAHELDSIHLNDSAHELDSIHSNDSAHELDSIHSNDSAHELDSIHSNDSAHELDSIHSNDSAHELDSIHSNDFSHVLPNREDFWADLQDANILSKEEEFVLIDTKRLKEMRFPTKKNFLKALQEEKFKDEKQQENKMNTVWLNPELNHEHEEHEHLIPRPQFERHFGNMQCWEAFDRTNAIKLIKRAEINENVKPCHVHLSHFDEIDDQAFTIIGINSEASKNIFQQLIEQDILSRDVPTRLLRRDIQDLHLTCFNQYRTEIVNVILMRYQYRIGIFDLINYGKHNLPARPHIDLFEKLIGHNIVMPIRVAPSINDENLTELLDKLYGKDQDQGCPSVTVNEIQNGCNIHSISKKLVSHLTETKIWFECSGRYYIINTKANIENITLPPNLKHLEYPLKNMLLAKISAESHKQNLRMKLISLQSSLYKFDRIASNLKPLEEYVEEETMLSMFKEIVGFSLNGLDHVISLHEKRWTWQCMMKIASIIVLGVMQTIAGIALEIFSLGAGLPVASGLIAEGFGDILFAAECLYTGYCSLKGYAKQKEISLAITVATQGIGAWFSREAQFSKFGYKIGGEALSKISGRRLIEEVGGRAIMKQATVRLGKKLTESAALGTANAGIEYAIEYSIREQLKKVCDSRLASFVTNCDSKIERYDIRNLSIQLQTQIGAMRAKRVIGEVCLKAIESTSGSDKVINQISYWIPHVSRVVSGSFASAGRALQRSGDSRATMLSQVTSIISKTQTTMSIVKSITSITATFGDSVFQEIARRLVTKIKENKENSMCYDEDINEEKFTNEVMANLKQVVREGVREKIEHDFLKPTLRFCTNMAIHYAGKAIKAGYNKTKTFFHWQEFEGLQQKYNSCNKLQVTSDIDGSKECGEKSISKEYSEELLKLQSKVRNPELFVHIIRQGVPVGIHCTQAVAEILGRPIHVRVHGGGEAIIIPNKFVPKGDCTSSQPLILDFFVGDNGIGHFENFGDSEGGKFDCLFDTLKAQGVDICREDIASRIERDDNLRDLVKSGIHEHFIRKGGVGGARRTEQQQKNMESIRLDLGRKGVRPIKLLEKGLQNHELMKRSIAAKIEWTEQLQSLPQSFFGKLGERYDHTDVAIHMRLDYRYLVFPDPNDPNKIRGHSGTFRNALGQSGINTAGQKNYHEQLDREFFYKENTIFKLHPSRSAQESTTLALLKHVKCTDINHVPIGQEGIPLTLTGHDLSNPQDFDEFRLGLNRQRYMVFKAAERLHENAPADQSYITDIFEEMESSFFGQEGCLSDDIIYLGIIRKIMQAPQTLKELGNLLMSAPSWLKNVNASNILDPKRIDTLLKIVKKFLKPAVEAGLSLWNKK